MTSRRRDVPGIRPYDAPDTFEHTVNSLLARPDFELENFGRLTHPMAYNAASDKFRAVEWVDAFARDRADPLDRPQPRHQPPAHDGTLHEAARRGVPIIVFNPLRERALERFADPQDVVEMATGGSTRIASAYHQVKAGGDAAALKGIMKALLALDAVQPGAVDRGFIADHTQGFDALTADLNATSWAEIEQESGLTRAGLEQVAAAYAKSDATIVAYGMGVTQHHTGTANVRLIADLLLRGNVGKPGAGICPLRGHSNVQGNRTVGITEKPSADFLARLQQVFGFTPPQAHGQYNTTIYGMDDRYRGVFGRRDVLFMHPADLVARGLAHGDRVDIETVSAERALRLEGITAIEYDIARGTAAAYYPEANVLLPLDHIDTDSGTPSYKSIPVRIRRSPPAPAVQGAAAP